MPHYFPKRKKRFLPELHRCTESSANGGSNYSKIKKSQKMIQLILALLLALAPAHHNSTSTHGSGTHVASVDDTGGETEHIPPPPPPPHQ
jgi:hypothetical protein